MIKRTIITLFALSCATASMYAQTINTIAGTGIAGFSGDGGPATAAMFNFPSDVAFDGHGNTYVSDAMNFRIRKIDASGIVTTIAGTGTAGYYGDNIAATLAQIGNVISIAADSAGDIYLADADNHRIRMIDTMGIIHTIAGNDTAGFSGDGGPAINAKLDLPFAVDVDQWGNVYISDRIAVCIRKVSAAGIISTIAGTPYVSGFVGDGGPATLARLKRNTAVAVDNAGNVYIADATNNRIRKVNDLGIISTIAGNGNIYYTGDGVPATSTTMTNPVGLAVDANGNVYTTEELIYRVRKINGNDTIITIAGTGVLGFSGDGGIPTAAQIAEGQVEVDRNGNVYVVDGANHRVRKISGATFAKNIQAGSGDLKLFPNPNDGAFTLTVELKTNEPNVSVEVLDVAGKILWKDNISVRNNKINTRLKLDEKVPSGHYILSIITANGRLGTNFEKR